MIKIGWRKLMAVYVLLVLAFVAITAIRAFGFENTIKASMQPEKYQTYFEPKAPIQGSLEELYQDVFMTTLLPYIQEAITKYYEENTGYSPIVAPYTPSILSIERPNGYRTFVFVIKLEIMPYLGAHIPIGVDHITISVSSGDVKVEKFEHIKSYPIPSWLQ